MKRFFLLLAAFLALGSPAMADPSAVFPALPAGAVQETAQATAAASVNTATLAAAVGHNTYLVGFQITGGGASSAAVVACTITGLQGGTITIDVAIPGTATSQVGPVNPPLSLPLISNGQNQAVAVSCPSFGTGNTTAAVSAEGYTF
jgi:Na+/phosphate symporter